MPGQATVTIAEKQWAVDVAASPSELAAGLGGVASIAANTGMLFDLGSEQTVQATTEPMLFNIDIIFISESLEVVDIVQNVAPGYLVTEDTPVRYFLEVNANESTSIDIGDTVEITDYEYTTSGILDEWMPSILQIAVLGFVAAMVGGMASVAFRPSDAAYRKKYLIPGREYPYLHHPTSSSSGHPSKPEEATFPVEARKDDILQAYVGFGKDNGKAIYQRGGSKKVGKLEGVEISTKDRG